MKDSLRLPPSPQEDLQHLIPHLLLTHSPLTQPTHASSFLNFSISLVPQNSVGGFLSIPPLCLLEMTEIAG